ncbi:MAG: transcription-repair coupling factor [Flavobacteriales bacterium]|jgi:transcription-repair coupling factor (superfamily II helicase)
MNILDELKRRYAGDEGVQQVIRAIARPGARVAMRGASGSALSFMASAVIRSVKQPVVMVLEDKERAAYALNDLEHLFGLAAKDDGPASMQGEDGVKLFFFPRSARVPYQVEQTENANVAMRAEVLNDLRRHKGHTVVVTYAEAIAENVVTESEMARNTYDIEVGHTLSLDFMDELFHDFGFEKVDYVYEPGQYAVRGGILDVFSYSFDHPYRIELFGDEVDSIRKFDPVTQLSVAKMTRATIVPDVSTRSADEARVNFLQFIDRESIVWLGETSVMLEAAEKELERARTQYAKLSGMLTHDAPDVLYSGRNDLLRILQGMRVIETGTQRQFAEGEVVTFDTLPQPAFNKNFDMLGTNLANNDRQGYFNVIAAGQPKQIERLHQIFTDKDHAVHFQPLSAELHEGFIDRRLKILLYTDHQIFERYHRFRLKEGFRKSKEAITLKEIMALQPGDYVVHIDHGVGQFSGLQKIDVNGREQEAIRLTYKGGDMLYVSIHSLHRISKYVGKEGTTPAMDKLGSNAWQNLKRKTKAKVKELAFDLIKLYAKRKATKGYAFSPDSYLQTELEASFIYEDTPDQLKATIAVKEDMESESPMDRLICGDVGFGKTEIAIRAAFKAVTDGKQVAVLVPTTILSLQHARSFAARLRDFPVKVDYINRFKTAKQQAETLKAVEKGEVDILIGTHALLGKKVKFKELGLLIIDEEQKFGVSAKDKLKTLKATVDTLTLTATPIPRTLQFSLMGARDLSIIQTAPPNRHPIRTELRPFHEEVIRDAISYEVQRGGQVFFVHNRVQNLHEIAGMVQRLCPDVRVGIAHGQMTGEQLEDVMTQFIEGSYDVLVSTAIVESGIDIPNANTIIINDAHHFGMSDLHQLRGRVGRNNKHAFCYLLSPPVNLLTDEARKRLTAIEQFSDLGSGLHIAMRDLDIRGAGNLLGGEQSGFINDIGFETYQKILNEAIDELKQEHFKDLYEEEIRKSKDFVKETTLETDFELLIPDDYVSSITERIALYKELDDISDEHTLDAFAEMLNDRFGPIPPVVQQLMDTMHLRWLARETGFEKLVLKSGKMIGYFITKQDSPFYQSEKFTRVLEFIKANPKAAKMYEKEGSLRLSFNEVNSLRTALAALQLMVDTRAAAG